MAKIAPEHVERIVSWREQGKSCRWIGMRLGVSLGAINYQCLKHGAISPRARGRAAKHGWDSFTGKDGRTFKRFTDTEDATLRTLAAEGLQTTAIAKRMGRARTSVAMRLMLLGQHEDLVA